MPFPFSAAVTPDSQGLVDTILRKGTPKRVHNIELFLDREMSDAISKRFGLDDGLDQNDPRFGDKRYIAVQKFLGYDFVRLSLEGGDLPTKHLVATDTAALQREGGRSYIDEHSGPITNWEEFEKYPWPNPAALTAKQLEWYDKNLPEGMCIIGSGLGSFAEFVTWLMGYEQLCYALYEQRDLVAAISRKLIELWRETVRICLQFDRVKIIWGHDDMGFKTGLMFSARDMREFVLPGHKILAEMAHAAGRPYLLHSCGDLTQIIPDLINDVRIDAKHSFEDTIEHVTEVKDTYGRHIALLGGIDVDFLCRSDEKQIRKRVRETLTKCMPGGGYCLGTGNSVANYIPVDNYLAMLDEGRKF